MMPSKLLNRFDARIAKRFTKPYLVDVSRPIHNWRGILSLSLVALLLALSLSSVLSTAHDIPMFRALGVVAALFFAALALPVARYWRLSGRKKYPYQAVKRIRYYVTSNPNLCKKTTRADSKGQQRPYIVSCARFLVFEDPDFIAITAIKSGEFISVASKLGEELEALFSLSVDQKIDAIDHFSYFFRKAPDTRITMAGGVPAPRRHAMTPNEIPLSSGLTWRLDKQPHALIAGGTGSGKTTFINYLIREVLLRDGYVYVADPKQSDLAALSQVLGSNVASSPNHIARVVRECRDLMEERYRTHLAPENFVYGSSWLDWDEKPVALFFDELAAFRASTPRKVYDEAFGYLSEIVLKGRQAGVFVILSAQQPRAETLSTDLRDQLGLRVALGNVSNECAHMVFGSADVSGLHSVQGPGEGHILLDGLGWNAPKPFSAPFVDYSCMDFMQEITALYAGSSMAQEAKGQASESGAEDMREEEG